MPESKQINFSIVPSEPGSHPRVYANFCAIAHTPFDMTLTFCEVLPLTDHDLQQAESEHVVKAPVRANIVIPFPMAQQLVVALQEHIRALSEQTPPGGWGHGPVH